MEPKRVNYRTWGTLLFVVGSVIGILFSVGAIWADLESSFYGFNKYTNEQMALSCPAYMGIDETATVSVRVQNTTDRDIRQLMRAQFSRPGLLLSVDEGRDITRGASDVFAWQVDRSNIDLEYFVFVNVYQFGNYPMPARQSTCGIFVVGLPFITGWQFMLVTGVLILGLLGAGWRMWHLGSQPLREHAVEASRALTFVSVLVPLTVLLSLFGSWILAGMLLVVCLLMGAVTLRFFLKT